MGVFRCLYEHGCISEKTKGSGLGGLGRAIARSSAVKTGVDPIQHCVIPSGSHSFATNVVFDSSVALKNIQSHTPKCG